MKNTIVLTLFACCIAVLATQELQAAARRPQGRLSAEELGEIHAIIAYQEAKAHAEKTAAEARSLTLYAQQAAREAAASRERLATSGPRDRERKREAASLNCTFCRSSIESPGDLATLPCSCVVHTGCRDALRSARRESICPSRPQHFAFSDPSGSAHIPVALPAAAVAAAPAPRSSQERKSAAAEPRECGICFDSKEISEFVLLVPCGHSNYCKKCIKTIRAGTRKCPTCSTHIQSTVALSAPAPAPSGSSLPASRRSTAAPVGAPAPMPAPSRARLAVAPGCPTAPSTSPPRLPVALPAPAVAAAPDPIPRSRPAVAALVPAPRSLPLRSALPPVALRVPAPASTASLWQARAWKIAPWLGLYAFMRLVHKPQPALNRLGFVGFVWGCYELIKKYR